MLSYTSGFFHCSKNIKLIFTGDHLKKLHFKSSHYVTFKLQVMNIILIFVIMAIWPNAKFAIYEKF